MTTDHQADQGKKLFGIGVLMFGQGLIWFHSYWPGGIFTVHPLNNSDAISRAEIVIGAILTAYGMLLWRSASHKLSFANYLFVITCASVLILCVSQMSEWVYFSRQQRGYLNSVLLEVAVTEITMVACIAVFGAWWADSAYMQARFDQYIESHRFLR
jgi:hypothetical protein